MSFSWKRGFKFIGKLRTETVFRCVFCAGLVTAALHAQAPSPTKGSLKGPALPREQLAVEYFDADAPWYVHNIPFLDIDDSEIQQIYYYRWKLYRSHVRQIGPQGTTVTEFLDQVPWEREPYSDLNDSASFHLAEGRWMRDSGIVDSLIDHLYSGGGNDRHFSESVATATYATTLVTGDPAPAARHLDTMQYIFNEWDDHFDRARNLYWIEPIADATEYTISSIDASGAGFTDQPSTNEKENGFTKGFAFRPSINSYQYANARAIAEIAKIAGRLNTSADYNQRADAIRSAVLAQLWNSALDHFTDRYQRSTKYVSAGEFIRGRELVGYVPWLYELPPKVASVNYAQAWRHVLPLRSLQGHSVSVQSNHRIRDISRSIDTIRRQDGPNVNGMVPHGLFKRRNCSPAWPIFSMTTRSHSSRAQTTCACCGSTHTSTSSRRIIRIFRRTTTRIPALRLSVSRARTTIATPRMSI